jgi:NAD-reducing hydrogenase small subunit
MGAADGHTNTAGIIPHDPDLPKILDKVYPCHEIVKIDYFLPGCPPRADLIWNALSALATGGELALPYETVKYD